MVLKPIFISMVTVSLIFKHIFETVFFRFPSDFDLLNKKLSRSFNAEPIPLTLIVKNDNIVFRKRGFNIGDEIEIRTKIEQALFE